MSDGFEKMLVTKRAAERRIRRAFDEQWARPFSKCDRCGVVLAGTGPAGRIHVICRGTFQEHRGYTPMVIR